MKPELSMGNLTSRTNQKIYTLWNHLFKRHDPNNICDEWYNYENFYNDVISLPGYQESLKCPSAYALKTSNGYYSKETCYWALRNAENKSGKYYGVTKVNEDKYRAGLKKNGIKYQATFYDEIAAANYYNHLSRIYNKGIYLNDVPYMSVYECLEKRIYGGKCNSPIPMIKIINKEK